MAYATLVPQTLKKNNEKYDHSTISKIFSTTPGSAKSSSTTSKVSPVSALDQLTTQDMLEKYCAENNIIYDSPTVEQFQNFFNKLFNQGVSLINL